MSERRRTINDRRVRFEHADNVRVPHRLDGAELCEHLTLLPRVAARDALECEQRARRTMRVRRAHNENLTERATADLAHKLKPTEPARRIALRDLNGVVRGKGVKRAYARVRQ